MFFHIFHILYIFLYQLKDIKNLHYFASLLLHLLDTQNNTQNNLYRILNFQFSCFLPSLFFICIFKLLRSCFVNPINRIQSIVINTETRTVTKKSTTIFLMEILTK